MFEKLEECVRNRLGKVPQGVWRSCFWLGAVAVLGLTFQAMFGAFAWKEIAISSNKIQLWQAAAKEDPDTDESQPLEAESIPNVVAREATRIWRVSLPEKARRGLVHYRGKVLQDGHEVGLRKNRPGDLQKSGGGGYFIGPKLAQFRLDDASDPRTNGRRYSLQFPTPVPPWLFVVAGVFLLAGMLGSKRPDDGAVFQGAWLPSVVFGVVFILRGAAVLDTPVPHDGVMVIRGKLFSDAALWNEMGVSLEEGRGFAGFFDGQRPFYSILLGTLYSLTGEDLQAARLMNAFCHALAAGCAVFLGRMLRSVLAGIVGAGVIALSGEHAHLVHTHLTESAGNAFVMLGLCLALSWEAAPSGRRWLRHLRLFAAGLLFVLGNWACPTLLLALPILCGILCLIPGREGIRGFTWRRIDLRPGFWFGLAAVVVLVPWLIRQKQVHGAPALSLQTAELLYGAASPGGKYNPAELNKELEAAGLSDAQSLNGIRYNFFLNRLKEEIQADPARYWRRVLVNALESFDFAELRHPIGPTGLTCALVLAALLEWRRRGRTLPVWLAFAITLGLTSLAWHFMPILVLVSLAVAALFWLRRGDRLTLCVLAASLLGLALLNGMTANIITRRAWVFGDWALWLLMGTCCLEFQRLVSQWLAGDRKNLVPLLTSSAPLVARSLFVRVMTVVLLGFSLLGGILLPLRPRENGPNQALLPTLAELSAKVPELAAQIQQRADKPWELRVIRLNPGRAFIPAGIECTNFSRAFYRKPHDRVQLLARFAPDETGKCYVMTIDFPGAKPSDIPVDPKGWWLVGGWRDFDPQAYLSHDTNILQAAVLVPLGPDSLPRWEKLRVFRAE